MLSWSSSFLPVWCRFRHRRSGKRNACDAPHVGEVSDGVQHVESAALPRVRTAADRRAAAAVEVAVILLAEGVPEAGALVAPDPFSVIRIDVDSVPAAAALRVTG